MDHTILVLNAGSSSCKFQLFETTARKALRRRMKAQFDGIGTRPRLIARDANGVQLTNKTWPAAEVPDVAAALDRVVDFLRSALDGRLPSAIGHRVVHGGANYSRPAIVDARMLAELEKLIPLAPLHQPSNLEPIRTTLARFPDLPQVACFDTAFHSGHPELSDRFALPEELYAEGVRRYGFHGLSYEYIAGRIREVAPESAAGKLVVAHLGSGASLCAIENGRSVDCTAGFSTLDGLPMGTRPGQLDAGVVLYLLQQKGMTVKEVEDLLYNECGLKGLFGISNDVRVLLESREPRAKMALDYFVYRISSSVAALAAAMRGLDGIVFTAGIGENSPAIRQAVADRLGWLGVALDPKRNTTGGPAISRDEARVKCYVLPTDEELMIAEHTLRTALNSAPAPN